MKTKINILWASMSGTAENVAQQFEKKAIEADFDVNISELNDVSMNDLLEMKNVAIITSTTGVGDLPTNGDDFWLENRILIPHSGYLHHRDLRASIALEQICCFCVQSA